MIIPGCPGEFPDVFSLGSLPGNELVSRNPIQNVENARKSPKFLQNLRKKYEKIMIFIDFYWILVIFEIFKEFSRVFGILYWISAD